jgi:hypothetical protein
MEFGGNCLANQFVHTVHHRKRMGFVFMDRGLGAWFIIMIKAFEIAHSQRM